jgi:hypothetical protein
MFDVSHFAAANIGLPSRGNNPAPQVPDNFL